MDSFENLIVNVRDAAGNFVTAHHMVHVSDEITNAVWDAGVKKYSPECTIELVIFRTGEIVKTEQGTGTVTPLPPITRALVDEMARKAYEADKEGLDNDPLNGYDAVMHRFMPMLAKSFGPMSHDPEVYAVNNTEDFYNAVSIMHHAIAGYNGEKSA